MLLKHLRVLCGVPTLVWALNQMFQIFFGPKNLSFYWSDPCRALWVYLWDHLERLTIVMGTFVCAAFVLVSSNDVWCPRPNCFPISTCGVPPLPNVVMCLCHTRLCPGLWTELGVWQVTACGCSHKYKIIWGVMVGGRRPLVEEDPCICCIFFLLIIWTLYEHLYEHLDVIYWHLYEHSYKE